MRVGEGVDAVDRVSDARGGLGCDPLGGTRDAADRRQDPDLVARADAAVGADIAFERCRGGARDGCRIDRIEAVGERAFEAGLQIVRMDVRAGRDSLRRGADREAVFKDRGTHRDRRERDLVAATDIGGQHHRDIAHGHDLAGQRIVQQRRHAVARIDPQSLGHCILLYR